VLVLVNPVLRAHVRLGAKRRCPRRGRLLVLSYGPSIGRGLSRQARVRYDIELFVAELNRSSVSSPGPPRALAGCRWEPRDRPRFHRLVTELVGELCLLGSSPATDVTWKTTFPMGIPAWARPHDRGRHPFVLSFSQGDFHRRRLFRTGRQVRGQGSQVPGIPARRLSTVRNFDKNYMESFAAVGRLSTPVLLVWE